MLPRRRTGGLSSSRRRERRDRSAEVLTPSWAAFMPASSQNLCCHCSAERKQHLHQTCVIRSYR